MVKIVSPSWEIWDLDPQMLEIIERAGRTAYKSESKIDSDSYKKFVKMIVASGHESVLEHRIATVKLTCDRGVTHEIVRHRIGSYTQESTRYCNYSKDKFGKEITVIDIARFMNDRQYKIWEEAMHFTESSYMDLIEEECSPQIARSVLPNSLKTEIAMTYNLREWRHFFKLRTAPAAHPQMREVTIPLLNEFKSKIPIVFDDIIPIPAKVDGK
jgi:thymidylate synthase (FAD)